MTLSLPVLPHDGDSAAGEADACGAAASAAPSAGPDAPADFLSWRWQLRHRITTREQIAARLPLTSDEEAGLDAAPGHFRVAITPYYFSLIDRDHPSCPVRMQVIPSAHELVNE